MGEKLFNALAAVSVDVLPLPPPKQTLWKFSVRVKDEVQFVHLFKSSAKCTTFVKCCSGICRTRFNKKIKAFHISDATICEHLKKFKEYIDAYSNKHPLLGQLDKELDDESDGEWDQESAAFHINDETDHDIETSDWESIQVWVVCVCGVMLCLWYYAVFVVLSKNALLHQSTYSLNHELHIIWLFNCYYYHYYHY